MRADPPGSGLQTRLHAYGTNIQREWDAVFAVIRLCHEVVLAMGAPRISSSLRFGTCADRDRTMDDKVRSVERKWPMRGNKGPPRACDRARVATRVRDNACRPDKSIK